MNAMLQRHNAKFIYAVPDGLRELMSDISREVLRSQPWYVYTFIADYLDALLITRENARIAARLVENIAEIASTIANFLERIGMSRDEAERTVIIIQTAFRKYLAAKPHARPNEQPEEQEFLSEILANMKILPERAEEAATIIQNAYRQFKEKQEKQRELLKGMVDWRIAARSAIYLYKKTGVTKEEANRAATLIKAAYKGYYTRRTMRYLAAQSRIEEPEEEPPEEEEEEGGEWYGEEIEEYLKVVEREQVEMEAEEETEAKIAAEQRSGTVVAEKIMEQILESVAQVTTGGSPERVETPPPSPQNVSAEFVGESPVEATAEPTTTDLEEGEYTETIGGEATDVSDA